MESSTTAKSYARSLRISVTQLRRWPATSKPAPLIILGSDQSMITAMKIMSEKGIKRAAMVKNGQLIGMLTEEAAKKAALQVKAAAT